ncbi:hypothetical protein VTO73DRAFT_103 [Trametes versicolor]
MTSRVLLPGIALAMSHSTLSSERPLASLLNALSGSLWRSRGNAAPSREALSSLKARLAGHARSPVPCIRQTDRLSLQSDTLSLVDVPRLTLHSCTASTLTAFARLRIYKLCRRFAELVHCYTNLAHSATTTACTVNKQSEHIDSDDRLTWVMTPSGRRSRKAKGGLRIFVETETRSSSCPFRGHTRILRCSRSRPAITLSSQPHAPRNISRAAPLLRPYAPSFSRARPSLRARRSRNTMEPQARMRAGQHVLSAVCPGSISRLEGLERFRDDDARSWTATSDVQVRARTVTLAPSTIAAGGAAHPGTQSCDDDTLFWNIRFWRRIREIYRLVGSIPGTFLFLRRFASYKDVIAAFQERRMHTPGLCFGRVKVRVDLPYDDRPSDRFARPRLAFAVARAQREFRHAIATQLVPQLEPESAGLAKRSCARIRLCAPTSVPHHCGGGGQFKLKTLVTCAPAAHGFREQELRYQQTPHRLHMYGPRSLPRAAVCGTRVDAAQSNSRGRAPTSFNFNFVDNIAVHDIFLRRLTVQNAQRRAGGPASAHRFAPPASALRPWRSSTTQSISMHHFAFAAHRLRRVRAEKMSVIFGLSVFPVPTSGRHSKSTVLAPWRRPQLRRERNHAHVRTMAHTHGQREGRVLRREDGNGVRAGSMIFVDEITESPRGILIAVAGASTGRPPLCGALAHVSIVPRNCLVSETTRTRRIELRRMRGGRDVSTARYSPVRPCVAEPRRSLRRGRNDARAPHRTCQNVRTSSSYGTAHRPFVLLKPRRDDIVA